MLTMLVYWVKHVIKKITKAVLDASKDVSLELNAEELSNYMFMSCHNTTG
jgi:hypothetical protein